MRLAIAAAICLASMPQAATSESPLPKVFGDWLVLCYFGMTVEEGPRCTISRFIHHLDDNRSVDVRLTIETKYFSSGNIDVYTHGQNSATCSNVEVKESVYRGYDHRHRAPTEKDLASIQERLMTTFRSHLRLMASCSGADFERSFPISIFDRSADDLRRAVDAVEENWRWHRDREKAKKTAPTNQ